MKQTAVEWLLENLNSEPYSEEEFNYNKECWDKAKEMEKEQIIDAYDEGYGIRDAYGDCFDNQIAEQYYNQIYDEFLTFKSEEDND